MTEARFKIPDNVSAIGFDWDGTIIDGVGPKLRQNQAIARKFERDFTLDEVSQIWRSTSTFDELMDRLTGGADKSDIKKVIDRDYNLPNYAKRKFNFDVTEKLAMLHDSGYKLALITSLNGDRLREDADSLSIDIDKYFDLIQTADSYEYSKPSGKAFDPLLRKFTIAAERFLYFGDEEKDFIGS